MGGITGVQGVQGGGADKIRACSACGAGVEPASAFCGFCGARTALETAGARLYIDETPLRSFEVGARSMVRLRIENCGDRPVERLGVSCSIADQKTSAASSSRLTSGGCAVLTMFVVPAIGGYAELSGELETVDADGQAVTYALSPLHVRIGTSGGQKIQYVHVDQRSARVVDNSRSQFGGEAEASIIPDGEASGQWRAIALTCTKRQKPSNPPLVSTTVAEASSEPAPVNFEVATKRAVYRLSRVAAQGDLATLYGGRRVQDGLAVVVKIADNPSDNDLIDKEARTLERLRKRPSHQAKHLPTALDQFRTSDGRLGTVMPELDGLDLETLQSRLGGAVPERHLIWIFRRALSVLGWAHANGVLHGNVEPAHLVIRPRDHNVWLVDWCWSIVEPAKTGQTFCCVNDTFSPPEARDNRPPLPASDIYSLAKTIIYAAGGDPKEKTIAEPIDDRLKRFLKFCAQESALGRPQDAWETYRQVDTLREEIFGKHEFVELVVP